MIRAASNCVREKSRENFRASRSPVWRGRFAHSQLMCVTVITTLVTADDSQGSHMEFTFKRPIETRCPGRGLCRLMVLPVARGTIPVRETRYLGLLVLLTIVEDLQTSQRSLPIRPGIAEFNHDHADWRSISFRSVHCGGCQKRSRSPW